MQATPVPRRASAVSTMVLRLSWKEHVEDIPSGDEPCE